MPDWGTICCWKVGWGTAGGWASVGAAMLVWPGIS
jgi:hypothetical protein